ncbi:hypothetical protein VTK73DRAFT_6483 [Phialemonium thermophilum]|uniref:Man(5)GlcNAc(2)-PP-dolichol translocation protein RFT1 n=1 Tax=Phialemonium thermophilum TaxID=223376 RepID=A0ABR3UZD3_9PEZI
MAVFSLAFAAAGYVALHVLRLGAVGLVWANAVNMACRIAWCAVFIARYFRSRGVPFAAVDKNVLPGPWSVLASVVAAQLVRRVVVGPATEQFLGARDTLVELVKIAVVALPYLAFLYVSDFLPTIYVYVFGLPSFYVSRILKCPQSNILCLQGLLGAPVPAARCRRRPQPPRRKVVTRTAR